MASRATLGLALCALGAGAALGHFGLPLLRQHGGATFALARYEAWWGTIWAHLICLAVTAGIVRLGQHKSIGPNAQLAIFHDACAMVGTALAVSLHGSGAAWPLAFLCAGKLLVGGLHALGLRRPVAYAVVWAYAATALALNIAFEGAGAVFLCERLLGAGAAARWLPAAAALDRFQGVAPPLFSVGTTFRFTLMRFVSWALDSLSGRISEATRPDSVERAYGEEGGAAADSPRIGAVGGARSAAAAGAFDNLAALSGPDSPHKVHPVSVAALQSSSWAALLSYALFPPTYTVGPIVDAAMYFQMAAAAAAGRNTTRALKGGAWWRAVARLAGCCAFAEALRRSTLSDGGMHSLLAAQPWQAFAVGYTVLTALFVQNLVPWTFARLSAAVLGIATVDEAPVGYLRSSATPRQFWRNWHVSWYRWLCAYVYIPAGGGAGALVAAVAVSAALHGASSAWLLFGAIQTAALLAERSLAARPPPALARLPPALLAGLAQCATMTTLLVQLPLGPSLPRFLLWFTAANLPFCVLNAARLAARKRAKPDSPGKLFQSLLMQKAPKVAWD